VSVAAAALILPLAGAILAIGLAVAGIGVPLLAGALARSTGRRHATARGELTGDLVELLRGAPELVLYGRADDRLETVRAADRAIVRDARRDALVAGLGSGLLVVVAGLSTVGVLAAAVSAHAAGDLDPVLVATVTLLALASFEGVVPLPGAAQELSATSAAGRRVLELLETPAVITDPPSPLSTPGVPVTVALESVTARYTLEGPPVLDAFDLVIPPGRRVALVGDSGAGKTTVTNLLLRFLDPESGCVTIGGQDIREMRQEDVRATFALAGQEAHVFNSTIRENLLLAQPGADEAKLMSALQRARLADWVATLPLGLDTLVGEEGSRLSGGQRQRLVLARALLVGAPVLILDEPTAHLDPETAEDLMRDVFAAAGNRSILLITHRREGLDLVDEIVELEAGWCTPAVVGRG
jgi:thiol reductant ABC exporter CydC subunit